MNGDDFDPLDELVSAYLDDEVTPDERARVESDPALQDRVAIWSAQRTRWAAVAPVDTAERESALAAALAAFDEADAGPATTTAPTPAAAAAPIVLATRRAERTRRMLAGLAVAAVLLLGVVLVTRPGAGDESGDLASTEAAGDTVAAAAEVFAAEEATDAVATAEESTAEALADPPGEGRAVEESLDSIDGAASATGGAEDAPAAKDEEALPATTIGAGVGGDARADVATANTEVELVALATAVREQLAAAGTAPSTDPCVISLAGLDGGQVVWQGVLLRLVLVASDSSTTAATEAVVVDDACVERVRVPL